MYYFNCYEIASHYGGKRSIYSLIDIFNNAIDQSFLAIESHNSLLYTHVSFKKLIARRSLFIAYTFAFINDYEFDAKY